MPKLEISFILKWMEEILEFFYVFPVKFDLLTASETTHPGELNPILDESKRSKKLFHVNQSHIY